ncbi:hypothetical protein YC2023_060513 [Brassica napus]
MSCGSVLINVRCEVSIDVGWEVSVDGRVVSVDGGRLVSVNERVLLSIDAVHIFFFCGLSVLNVQDLKRAVFVPCCFWYCWACT